MKQLALFLALLAIFLVLTFPHQFLVHRLLAHSLAEAGVDVSVADARPALPLGLRVSGVTLSKDGYSLSLPSVYLGLLRSFATDSCGGSISGSVGGGGALEVEFNEVDPASCLDLAGLTVSGKFDGEVDLDAGSGSLRLRARDGTVGGHLPPASGSGESAQGIALGEWDFSELTVEATLEKGRIRVDRANATAAGVDWLATRATLTPVATGKYRLDVSFRAKAGDGATGARAMIGLLPKATENSQGWRSYRLTGTLDQPRLIGLK